MSKATNLQQVLDAGIVAVIRLPDNQQVVEAAGWLGLRYASAPDLAKAGVKESGGVAGAEVRRSSGPGQTGAAAYRGCGHP